MVSMALRLVIVTMTKEMPSRQTKLYHEILILNLIIFQFLGVLIQVIFMDPCILENFCSHYTESLVECKILGAYTFPIKML